MAPQSPRHKRKMQMAMRGFARIVLAAMLCGPALLRAGEPGFGRDDWPFQPPLRPAVPTVSDPSWAVNPIDTFIQAELEAEGLTPSPPADKLTLLRRVTLDLTGLPPGIDEQDAFVADTRPDAYERVVDRLLDSPAYGERWARHWLDLVRYAETDGFKSDDHRPNAYKYRDWVIQAFNADLPYDRFIALQLAGDELEPENPRAWIATGLNRLYPDEYNAANLEQRRQEILDDITATTGSVFLGLTMGCAQCHDHKFDEISQADYFSFQAFFAPLVARDDVDAATAAERDDYRRRLDEWQQSTQGIRDEIEALLGEKYHEARQYALTKFREEIQQAVRLSEAERTPYQQQIAIMALKQAEAKQAEVVGKLTEDEKRRYEQLQEELRQFDAIKPAPLEKAMAATDLGTAAPPTFRLDGGNWRRPAEEVEPGYPAFLSGSSAEAWPAGVVPPENGQQTTGRRSALARWLTRPDHPLTSRVMVNRLWQHHFGVGIVPTPNDFGAQGDPPSHPRLLDWLAAELVEHGWSLKRMHRLMVTSATYRQASRLDPANEAQIQAGQRDVGNKLLWRARRQRLEGEALHDAMLAVSGRYNRRMFGPSARPPLPEGISPNYAWKSDDEANTNRRGIYVLAKRNLRYPLLDAFDLPDMHHSCARRAQTTTALQALVLVNGELALDCARHWAGGLLSGGSVSGGSDDAWLITQAYRQAFGRSPASDESSAASAFLAEQAELIRSRGVPPAAVALPLPCPAGLDQARAAAVVDFCHALLNANEFVYVD